MFGDLIESNLKVISSLDGWDFDFDDSALRAAMVRCVRSLLTYALTGNGNDSPTLHFPLRRSTNQHKPLKPLTVCVGFPSLSSHGDTGPQLYFRLRGEHWDDMLADLVRDGSALDELEQLASGFEALAGEIRTALNARDISEE
jgi:hypothetical protein